MKTFIWPTDTKRVTSQFRGSRHDHNGVDIAEGGYHPIYAAADGKVRRSYTSSSYGECIMIEHEINGDTWETVYAHMKNSSRTVFDGERVKQGQQIGIMGNTGNSTGQHLHFELHRGNWNINKSDAVDPLDYLEKDLYPSDNLLREGDKGQDVKKLQLRLIELGYSLPKYGADGDFGNETEAAVKDFQRDQGIAVDGIAGPVTLGELEEEINEGDKVYFPPNKGNWNVYPLSKKPVHGNEKGEINPTKFGGLTYEILDRPQKNVVTIQTSDFGKVNVYVAPSTGAVIK